MANNSTVTYEQLVSILGALGYAPDATRTGPGYVVFTHHGPGRVITLPASADRETVPTMYLNAIRGNLKLSLPDEVPHFDQLLDELISQSRKSVPVS